MVRVSSWPRQLLKGYGCRGKVAVAPPMPQQTRWHTGIGKVCCGSTGTQARRNVSARPVPTSLK